VAVLVQARLQLLDLSRQGGDGLLKSEDRGVLLLEDRKQGGGSLIVESLELVAGEHKDFTNQAIWKFQPAGQAE
jgi:hypothetical protein